LFWKRRGGNVLKRRGEMMKYDLRSLNKLVKDKDETEITRYKGQYYILHICKNGVPVPLNVSEDAREIAREIKLHGY
jgi:hypothetical protein